MPQDPAAALSTLLRSASIDDHDEVLKAANAAIKANKSDHASQHTRVVALLKLDRFEDAVRALTEGGTALESKCALEKAYALYKLGKLEDASRALNSGAISEVSSRHMAAQVAYRAERFDEAYDIYAGLKSGAGEEENDIGINMEAAMAQSRWQRPKPPANARATLPDTFELCYNAACVDIAQGNLEKALILLQRALRICDASDDLLDEDKKAEMRPMLVQQAYVYARLNKVKEALDLYHSLDATSETDPDLTVITENNLAVVNNEPSSPYLVQKNAAQRVRTANAAKLFKYQATILSGNSLVADLCSHKVGGIPSRTAKRANQQMHPSTDATLNALSAVDAAAIAHGKTGKALVRSLQGVFAKRPNDVGFLLAIIQAQIQQSHTGAALSLLQSFLERLGEKGSDAEAGDVRYCPGLVALTVALMRSQGSETSARRELSKAAKYWQGRSAGNVSSLLREAGVELLHSSNHVDLALAGSTFEELLSESKDSHIASAGLVASLAPIDPSKVQKYATDLPPVDSLIGGVEVSSLLSSGIATFKLFSPGPPSKKRPSPDDVTGASSSNKRRRKRKLPKNYVEGAKLDPERWLPLRDRSSYRPKGRKGKKKAMESTQGGMVKDEETLELVGGGGVRVEKAGGGGGGAGGGGGGASGGGKKKKKGKK